jgi:hypothetical protein
MSSSYLSTEVRACSSASAIITAAKVLAGADHLYDATAGRAGFRVFPA